MIYTVTPNPSVDCYMSFEDGKVVPGAVNRASEEWLCPGGKGVNVSLVLGALGSNACALGFVGGESGELFLRLLAGRNAAHDFIRLSKGSTRINVKVYDGEETALNAPGPEPAGPDTEALLRKVEGTLKEGDVLVLNGKVHGKAESLFLSLADIANAAGALLVVDTEKNALLPLAGKRPFLIKPNLEELAQCFQRSAVEETEAVSLCRILQKKGARNILLSMGGKGALFIPESGKVLAATIRRQGAVVSTVGAGDSMLAGFLHGCSRGMGLRDTLRLATAAGSACAFSSGLPERETIEELLPCVEITEQDI